MGPDDVYTAIPNLLEFRRSLNAGAVFGAFSSYPLVFIIASILALGFVLFVFWGSRRSQWAVHLSLGMILSGALGNLYDRTVMQADIVRISGGDGQDRMVIGKVVDVDEESRVVIGVWPEGTHRQIFSRENLHITRQGVVRDFLKFTPRFPGWVPWLGGYDVWPWIFNIADSALVVGVSILLIASFRERPKRWAPDPPGNPPSGIGADERGVSRYNPADDLQRQI